METYINIFWSHLPCFPLQINIDVIVNKLVDAEEENCLFFCGVAWFWNPEVTAVEGQALLSYRKYIHIQVGLKGTFKISLPVVPTSWALAGIRQ